MSSTDAITVFLPHVFANIKESRIRAIMYSLGWGFVKSVDIKQKKGTDGKVNIVFVHFSSWSDGDDASKVRQMLDADEKVSLVLGAKIMFRILKAKLFKQGDLSAFFPHGKPLVKPHIAKTQSD